MPQNRKEIRLFHGEALFSAGQMAREFYMIKSGAIYILDKKGVIALKQFFAAELFGIPEVLAQGRWANTAIARGTTVLICFDASHLFSSLNKMPETQSNFIRHIASLV